MKRILCTLILACAAFAQENAPAPVMTVAEKEFMTMMNNVVLSGYFTVGDSKDLRDDRYVIESVSKVREGLWKFAARIQYNNRDMPVMLNVPVFFAGDTPVISLTRQAVGGMGTFDTRLVIYKGGYAGTWGGGDHGGKMFGNIVKNEAPGAAKP